MNSQDDQKGKKREFVFTTVSSAAGKNNPGDADTPDGPRTGVVEGAQSIGYGGAPGVIDQTVQHG